MQIDREWLEGPVCLLKIILAGLNFFLNYDLTCFLKKYQTIKASKTGKEQAGTEWWNQQELSFQRCHHQKITVEHMRLDIWEDLTQVKSENA